MTDNEQKPVLIVCGLTASGKSALAVDVAVEFDGLVINADSMQVYRELRILTARPSQAEAARALVHPGAAAMLGVHLVRAGTVLEARAEVHAPAVLLVIAALDIGFTVLPRSGIPFLRGVGESSRLLKLRQHTLRDVCQSYAVAPAFI